jgi:hypothetical protein
MGAIWPGRWQVWQFLCKIGRTSLLNVTVGEDVVVSAAMAAIPIRTSAQNLIRMRSPSSVLF